MGQKYDAEHIFTSVTAISDISHVWEDSPVHCHTWGLCGGLCHCCHWPCDCAYAPCQTFHPSHRPGATNKHVTMQLNTSTCFNL